MITYVLNGQMRVPNKPCYLENRVVREPCKQRIACTFDPTQNSSNESIWAQKIDDI